MTTTLPNMGLVLPVIGGSSGTWGQLLSNDLTALDAHRHIPGEGARIPAAGLGIDGDVSFGGFSPTSVRSVVFSSGQAVSGARKLYVGANGELYWNNDATGTAIQLTSGTTLNYIFAGGIGGDYAAVSALLSYEAAGERYKFLVGGGVNWAHVAAGNVRLHEHGTNLSTYVQLAPPAALASSYTVTFPAAVPAGKRLVQVSAAGTLTFENTGIEASTFSGLITASAGVTAAGAITANAGVTATTVSASGNVTAADLRFTSAQTLEMDPTAAVSVVSGSPEIGVDGITLGTTTSYIVWPVSLPVGSTLVSWSLRVRKTSAAGTIQAEFGRNVDGSYTRIGSVQSNSANNPGLINLGETVNQSITSGGSYHVRSAGGGTAGDSFYRLVLTFTRP